MKKRFKRGWILLALALSGGTVFQGIGFTRNGVGGNCQSLNFFGNGVASAIDFCVLLDCQNGFLGGVVRPCAGATGGSNFLIDCGSGTSGTGTPATTTTTTPTTTGP